MWLYKSDGSDPAKAIHWVESKLHPSAQNIYTHSSIELKNGDQFTAHKDHGNGVGGFWVVDSRSDILFNQGGNQGRSIDVYRHEGIGSANVDRMDSLARTFAGESGRGVYGLTGVCSTATAEGLQAAGLKMNGDFFPTPQSLSSDGHLNHVGSYNTGHTYNSPSWNIYSAPQSELPR